MASSPPKRCLHVLCADLHRNLARLSQGELLALRELVEELQSEVAALQESARQNPQDR